MKERRREPRVPIELELELRLPGQKTAPLGKSVNLSSNGLYFVSEYFMEESTRLPILIKLPEMGACEATTIRPEGIVVRCRPDREDPAAKSYEIACYFMSLDDEERENLTAYLAARLQSQNAG